jgi:hypothetical protein
MPQGEVPGRIGAVTAPRGCGAASVVAGVAPGTSGFGSCSSCRLSPMAWVSSCARWSEPTMYGTIISTSSVLFFLRVFDLNRLPSSGTSLR